MKKLITCLLALTMLLSMTGCGLFADSTTTKLGDYDYSDPKDLKYDNRTVLNNDNFAGVLEDAANSSAYPDTMVYDDDNNVIGIYDYDPSTGLAMGWSNFSDGSYTAFEAGEEVDLGMPDASQMVTLSGDISLYAVVYDKDSAVCDAWLYLMLSDAADKDTVTTAMENAYGFTVTAESDTVLKTELDADFYADVTADEFSQTLMQYFGVSTYGGVNAYEPYAGHEDPTDVDFDQKVVLTGSGSAAVQEGMEGDISSQTEIVYGKDGKVVAQYSYYEAPSKEAADKLEEFYANAVGETRVSDTVVGIFLTGQNMQDTVSAYQGYNVIKDDSVDEYVRMLKETFFVSECK